MILFCVGVFCIVFGLLVVCMLLLFVECGIYYVDMSLYVCGVDLWICFFVMYYIESDEMKLLCMLIGDLVSVYYVVLL